MANVKISALPAATALNDASVTPFVISGVTDKVSWKQIKTALLDVFYPVGSVYISAQYSTPEQVNTALGGGLG